MHFFQIRGSLLDPSDNLVVVGGSASSLEASSLEKQVQEGRDLDTSQSAAALLVATNPPFWVSGTGGNGTGFAAISGEEDYSDLNDEGFGAATKKPSVIFPSIENKPILVNNSFTYDSGKNLEGATVKIVAFFLSFLCSALFAPMGTVTFRNRDVFLVPDRPL